MANPNFPEPPDAPEPPGSVVANPNQPGGRTVDQKKQIIDGIIVPDFKKIAGRAPSQQEIDEYYDIYTRFGGDAFRSKVTERFQGDFFKKNLPTDFGAPPSPFGETYTAGSYAPPTFNEPFVAPTAEDLLKDPGYLARMQSVQRGLERGAAAKGSILSGGFVGQALPRALSETTGSAYQNLFGRAFDTYQQKYGMFSDAAARSANAFQTNELGKLNQFQTRYKSYRDLIEGRRQSEIDRWNREMDLAHLGKDSTAPPA